MEIRRELFSGEELNALAQLAEKIKQNGLFAVYSVPFALFNTSGKLNPDANLTPLKVLLAAKPVKLVVENDQSSECGILSRINAFMFAAESLHLPLGMTFDMANWLWVGQDPATAVERLACHVGYVQSMSKRQKSVAENGTPWRSMTAMAAGSRY